VKWNTYNGENEVKVNLGLLGMSLEGSNVVPQSCLHPTTQYYQMIINAHNAIQVWNDQFNAKL
jgi:hypothetical protein